MSTRAASSATASVRSTNLRVRDIMVTSPMTCPPETPIADAAHMMSERTVSSILVQEGEEVVGIWTEHDALAHDLEDRRTLDTPISQYMSSPVATIAVDATANDAALRFKQMDCRHFVVLDESQRPAGLISQSDVVLNHGVEWFMRLQTVDSVVQGVPPIAGPEESTSSVARRLHHSHHDAMVVRDPEGGLGILTERDVVRYIASRHEDCPAWELSSRPLQTVRTSDSLFNARNLMVERGFRHLGVIDADGEFAGLIGFGSIIASIEHGYIEELELALEERDAALRDSEERYRALVELSPDAIAVHRDGRLLFINPAGARLLGADDPGELLEQSLTDFLESGGDSSPDHLAAAGNGVEIRHARLVPLRGEPIDVELSARPISYGSEAAWQVILRDITDRKRMEDELRRLATTDQLTGLYNRPHFETLLDKAISGVSRYKRGFALLMFDIDRFKTINDELGHDVGDRILRDLVECLAPRLRESDVFCRWGGEEFLVLAHENDEASAMALGEKLLKTLRDSVSTEATGPVTASFGVAVCRAGETRQQLLKRLDEAMYQSKRNGRDRVELAE